MGRTYISNTLSGAERFRCDAQVGDFLVYRDNAGEDNYYYKDAPGELLAIDHNRDFYRTRYPDCYREQWRWMPIPRKWIMIHIVPPLEPDDLAQRQMPDHYGSY